MANNVSANDGGIVYGTQDVTPGTLASGTFTAGATTFTAENIKLARGSRKIENNARKGAPSKKAHVRTTLTGSAELQAPDSSTPAPDLFSVILLTPNGGAAAKFVITEVSDAYEQFGETKYSVSIEEILNPAAFTVSTTA